MPATYSNCTFRLTLPLCISIYVIACTFVNGMDEGVGVTLQYEESQVLDVDFSSPYCNTSARWNLIDCSYASTNMTIRFPIGLSSSTFELSVFNPAKLIFHPVCISRISIQNAPYFTTLPAANEGRCSTWIRLWNSSIDYLSHGIHDVSLNNCNVKTINLRDQRDFKMINSRVDHIEWINWEGYTGFVYNSSISKISHLSTSEQFIVNSTSIDVIGIEAISMRDGAFTIRSSTIRSIETYGISVHSGLLTFDNVTIQKMSHLAIFVDAITQVRMVNVRIIKGMKPSFFFPTIQNVQLENVTIDGELLTFDSEWVEQFDHYHGKLVTRSTEGCVADNDVLECNFSRYPKTFYHIIELEGISTLIVKNAHQLSVDVGHCINKNITILHSNVSDIIAIGKPNCNSSLTLHVRNSSIESLQASLFEVIDIKESFIQWAYIQNVDSYHFLNVNFGLIESLVTKVGAKGNLKHCLINHIFNASIAGPLKITSSTISKIQHFKLDHPNEVSVFRDVVLEEIRYKNFLITSGHLKMVEVSFLQLMQESIYLEEGATLFINNSQPLPLSIPEFISVTNLTQVKIRAPNTKHEKIDYVTIRQNDIDSRDFPFEFEIVINGTYFPAKYCYTFFLRIRSCNFKDLEGAVNVKLMKTPGIDHSRIWFSNIQYLAFQMMNMESAVLYNISNGTISDGGNQMQRLVVYNSHFTEVKGRILDLQVINSSIGLLAIETEMTHAQFKFSNVSVIEKVIILKRNIVEIGLIFTNGSIDLITSAGLFVMDTALISNTSIGTIQSHGIYAFSDLIIMNSIIENADKFAINVYGTLHLENVSILTGHLSSLKIIGKGSITCENVTINGHLIKLTQKLSNVDTNDEDITVPMKAHNPNVTTVGKQPTTETSTSVIALNVTELRKIVTKSIFSEEEISTISNKPLENDVRVIPEEEISTMSNKPLEKDSQVIPEEPKATPAATGSLTWIAAIMGFILGVGATAAIIFSLVMFRPNTKILIPTPVHWSVRDDQHDLISNDEDEVS